MIRWPGRPAATCDAEVTRDTAPECAQETYTPSAVRNGAYALATAVALGVMLAGCAGSPKPEGSVGAVRAEEERSAPASLPGQRRGRPGLTPPFLEGRPISRLGLLLNFSTLPQESEALYNAAELALFEQNDPSLLLIPRDAGTGAGPAATAAEVLGKDGAEVIVGPLVRDSVLGARTPARRAQAPVIAFSTDRTAAGDGAYLLSFQSEEEVARIVTFAVRQGLSRIAVLAPDSEYGRRTEAEARRVARLANGQVVASQLYTPTPAGAAAAAQVFAPTLLAAGAQAVLIPGDASAASAAAEVLTRDGADASRVRLLGLGQWGVGPGFRYPSLAGAWVAAVDPGARREFERRYRAAYGKEPIRLASLAYDAVTVAAALARTPEGATRQQLERPEGFQGADGLFRFRSDGTIQRALPVFEVRANGTYGVLDAAPQTFPPPGA